MGRRAAGDLPQTAPLMKRRFQYPPAHDFTFTQKIELAKNLLIYSDYSFIDIANYLGFTSQSHLGARFKAATGMTLREYRNKYKKEDF